MRRVFMYVMLLCCMIFSTAVSAAQVTDAKWGVDANNVLRLVIDADAPVSYTVDNQANTFNLTVNAPFKDNSVKSMKVRSTLAPTMQIVPSGDKTIIRLNLTRAISSSDYKVFTLKQDPKTKRPFRVVADIMADKKEASKVNIPVSKPTGGKVVVSNKPVVGNKPVSTGNVVEEKPVVKPVVKQPESKNETKDEDKDDKKDADKPKKDKTTGKGLKGKVITLDPGHGGSDPGAIGAGGTKEKDITLMVAEKLEEILKKRGAKVYMTRTSDKDVYGPYAKDAEELQARVNVAEKHDSDLFISLHINSSVNKNIGGFTSYYYPKTANDLKLAKAIQNQLTSNFGVDDLGVREANFYITKRCSMPATLLELCFISNPKEEKLMKSKWFQNKTAKLIADGIEEYFK